MNPLEKLNLISKGFKELNVDQKYKDEALKNIEKWLLDTAFADYTQQIDYLIETKKWDLLLDSFYQTISFGTGGRRGPVGIGPNRINVWTIQSSSQGHSQYLIKQFGEEAKKRGVVISYDVRKYTDEGEFDNNRFNPVKDLDCRTLAMKSAEVYAANDINVYIFEDFAPTPELSFTVRDKKAISGVMISASHNPPNHNGQKVVNETGGQLTPPYDQNLVDTIINDVKEIKVKNFEEAVKEGLIHKISENERYNYIKAAKGNSINSSYRSIKSLYSPLHGTSYKTMPKAMKELGFDFKI
jgi:phosphoglucomutase